jgi:hypothetical protein
MARAFRFPGGRRRSQPDIKLELSCGSYRFARGEGWSSEVEEEAAAEEAPLSGRPCDEPISEAVLCNSCSN